MNARANQKSNSTDRAPFPTPTGLHQQRLDEDKRVKDEAAAKKTLAAAEAEAEAQFKADQQAAAAARAALGTWVSGCGDGWVDKERFVWCLFFNAHFLPLNQQDEDESGHLYNARLRYYYNKCVGEVEQARRRCKTGF